MIEGISHITFIVNDLDKTSFLFEEILNSEIVYKNDSELFLMAGNIWIALIKGKPLTEKTYNHIAFKIKEEDFDLYVKRVQSLGLEIKSSRARTEKEGRSLYFYDYDNHLIELHTGNLETRLEYLKND